MFCDIPLFGPSGETGFVRVVAIIPYGHTFATLSLKSGVDVTTLSHTLGHFSAGFTLSTYTHATEEMKRDAADAIGEVIAKAM